MRRCEKGSTHVLEAVVGVSIMVSAIAFVATFQTDGTLSAYERVSHALEIQTKDFVSNRFDWPLERALCVGETKGEQWLLDAATMRRSSFRDQVNDSYPPGIEANLLVKNGYGEMWLYKEFDNPAIAGHAIRYEPNWSGTYVVPLLDVASGAEQVEINTAAVVKGELAMQKGEGIEIVVTFEGGKQERLYASTALLGEVWQYRQFAQNLTLVTPGTTQRTMTLPVEADKVAAPPGKQPKTIAFMISPGPQGGSNTSSAIPADTSLTVRFPPQWSGLDFEFTSADWEPGTSGNMSSGIVAIFVLKNASTQNETIRLDALAPTLPTQTFDLITAELSNGGLARSEFVVQYPAGVDKGLPITIHPSIPYPLRGGSSAVFGLAIANGGPGATIRQVDYIIPGGFDMRHNDGRGSKLFAGGGEPESVGGSGVGGVWTRVDSRHVQWKGYLNVSAAKAAELLVSVNITSDLTQATAVEGVWTPRVSTALTYNNSYATTSTGWGSTPGFMRSLVKPDTPATLEADGYPYLTLVGNESLSYPVTAKISMPTTTMTGTTSYTIVPGTSDLGRVQNAAGNASTRILQRVAPLGSLVTVENDVSNLLTTLADEGAGGITIQTELYTPVGQACGPTATWSRNASTLPLARINALRIYDETGVGTPAVYLASEDKNAYKINSLGITSWSREHASEPSAIATATMPVTGASIFTGSTNGTIARLDPSLTGSIAWSAVQQASADVTSDPTLRAIVPNSTSGLLLSWSDQVLDVRNAQTGNIVATRDLGIVTNKIRQAAWDADGSVLILTTHALQRLDANLIMVGSFAIEDAVGFSITPAGILLARANIVTILGPTLSPIGSPLTLAGNAKLTAAGDATNDGVNDLVVALDTLAVQVINGASGAIVATYNAALPNMGSLGAGIPAFGPISRGEAGVQMEAFDAPVTRECREASILQAYDVGQVCIDIDDPNNLAPLPLLLDAMDGRILYSYRMGSVAKTVAWGSDGTVTLEIQHEPTIMPTSEGMGVWTLGTRVFAIATSDGKLCLYDAATGLLVRSVSPTSSTGTFQFTLRVPMGGFFGTNILLTRIQWQDAVFGPQEAVLPEWFQVVAPDGKPVLSQFYTIEALMQTTDMPMTARG